jgi:hypothetical protein
LISETTGSGQAARLQSLVCLGKEEKAGEETLQKPEDCQSKQSRPANDKRANTTFAGKIAEKKAEIGRRRSVQFRRVDDRTCLGVWKTREVQTGSEAS